MVYDQRLGDRMIGAVDPVADAAIIHDLYTNIEFCDDITGKGSPKELTIKARAEEIRQVHSHRIYDETKYL